MRYSPIVSLIHKVDSGLHAPVLEKQEQYCCGRLSNELLWMGTETHFSYLKKSYLIKINISIMLYLEYFHYLTLLSDSPF